MTSQLLLDGIQLELPDSKENWIVHRVAQRLLVNLGHQKELDMDFLRENLDKIVYNIDVNKLQLSSSVSLGIEGDILCWALFVLLKLELGNTQKNHELGKRLFINVPLLDEQLRTDILKYHIPFVRTGTHPRWLIEAYIKGVEFKDNEQPHWIQAEYSGEEIPQAKASKLFQQKLIEGLTQLTHGGFCHCTHYQLASYSRIGIFYRLLLALCENGDQVVLWLSEVGPYVYIMKKDGDNAPNCIKSLSRNKLSAEDIIEQLKNLVTEKGGKIMTDEELDLNLSNFNFRADLGYVSNRNDLPCGVFNLLYTCTD